MKKKAKSPNHINVLVVSANSHIENILTSTAGEKFPLLTFFFYSKIPPALYPYDLLVLPVKELEKAPSLMYKLPVLIYGPLEKIPFPYLEGCFDFLLEPWQPLELCLRALRVSTKYRFRIQGVMLHLHRDKIQAGSYSLPLTNGEFHLLRTLGQAKGKIISRKQIEAGFPTSASSISSRRLDICVARVRKKLKRLLTLTGRTKTNPILSVRGKGYYLLTD
ncbi:MAG: winged helix-turn-helix domain-containing protein [Spirochaetales bacterium]